MKKNEIVFFLSFKPFVISAVFLLWPFFIASGVRVLETVQITIFYLVVFCVPQLIKEIYVVKGKEINLKKLASTNIPGLDMWTIVFISFLYWLSLVEEVARVYSHYSVQDFIRHFQVFFGYFIGFFWPVLISKTLFLISLLCWHKIRVSKNKSLEKDKVK